MITDKLTIYGDKENKECILSLVEKCSRVISPECEGAQVFTQGCSEELLKGADSPCVILEYKDKASVAENVKCITYSLSDSRADVTALNVQNREHSVCFELLHNVFMSRVFIPNTSGYTPLQVLICSAVLLSAGVSAQQIVETLNDILK